MIDHDYDPDVDFGLDHNPDLDLLDGLWATHDTDFDFGLDHNPDLDLDLDSIRAHDDLLIRVRLARPRLDRFPDANSTDQVRVRRTRTL